LTLQRKNLGAYLRTLSSFELLIDMPGNTGDKFIEAGTFNFLEIENVNYIPLPFEDFNVSETKAANLLVPGSGAFSKYWHEWLPDLILRASKVYQNIIILPSGYDPSVEIVREALSCPNVYAFAREANSYRLIKNIAKSALAFDCALYNKIPSTNSTLNSGVLLALREDQGSLLKEKNYSPVSQNNDISLRVDDLGDWVYQISGANQVVTDRLHVAVAATLAKKDLIIVDPYESKLSNYFEFIYGKDYLNFVHFEDYEWLLRQNFIMKS
jgi:exopolysaccharide biosynthesis predicted pyruvyltransferase EpsI